MELARKIRDEPNRSRRLEMLEEAKASGIKLPCPGKTAVKCHNQCTPCESRDLFRGTNPYCHMNLCSYCGDIMDIYDHGEDCCKCGKTACRICGPLNIPNGEYYEPCTACTKAK